MRKQCNINHVDHPIIMMDDWVTRNPVVVHHVRKDTFIGLTKYVPTLRMPHCKMQGNYLLVTCQESLIP